ncbi:prepilin-type N-terminal cleavage/methylation domain-containing protein [Thermus sp. PS18]|uniref:PilW family protein n=1 Tax=Thermus sp. PS18 TaxID=2849039 RepID=UPI002264C01E|nr:prepilin-type N-terminal cleavage/methylation domain-containing protein [Thermus sp. PS18]UZX14347.1 prepilin-type N-terminal cleavage/methylation domain-containing protein [Thermus sp. PS18]
MSSPGRWSSVKGRGFSLVEVLLAMALLVVIFGLAVRYFTHSSELARETQIRSELQDRVRMVMQVVSGDLQMAGARYWNSGDQNKGFSLPTGKVLRGNNDGAKDSLSLYYVTSLRNNTEACRRVDYDFVADTLRRSDVNATPSTGNDCTEPAPSYQPLAEGILALDIVYLCSNGVKVNEPDCGADAYPRSAIVEVVGYSLNPIKTMGPQNLITVSNESLSCPAGRGCYALRQEVLMPNLKPLPQ